MILPAECTRGLHHPLYQLDMNYWKEISFVGLELPFRTKIFDIEHIQAQIRLDDNRYELLERDIFCRPIIAFPYQNSKSLYLT